MCQNDECKGKQKKIKHAGRTEMDNKVAESEKQERKSGGTEIKSWRETEGEWRKQREVRLPGEAELEERLLGDR